MEKVGFQKNQGKQSDLNRRVQIGGPNNLVQVKHRSNR